VGHVLVRELQVRSLVSLFVSGWPEDQGEWNVGLRVVVLGRAREQGGS